MKEEKKIAEEVKKRVAEAERIKAQEEAQKKKVKDEEQRQAD